MMGDVRLVDSRSNYDSDRLNWLEPEWRAGRIAIVNPSSLPTSTYDHIRPTMPLRDAIDRMRMR